MACALLGFAVTASASCDPRTFRLALDIGHGAGAPGAISARGRPEFAFNTDIARAVLQRLRSAGVREARILPLDGPTPTLASRVAAAEAMQADFFLSLHHDSVQERFLDDWVPPGQNQTRAMSRHAAGYSLFISQANGDTTRSLRFARALGEALQAQGFHYTDHHAAPIPGENRPLVDPFLGVYRFDGLFVLRRNRMPAVLFEVGVIKHPEEELMLADPATHTRVADAVTQAVFAYCAG